MTIGEVNIVEYVKNRERKFRSVWTSAPLSWNSKQGNSVMTMKVPFLAGAIRERWGLAWIALALVPIVFDQLGSRTGLAENQPDLQPNCHSTANIRLVVGNFRLNVPRNYSPNLYGNNINKDKLGNVCQQETDPAIKVNQLSIYTESSRFITDERAEQIKGAQIFLYERDSRAAQITDKIQFDEAVDTIRAIDGRELGELPLNNGFLTFEPSSGSGIFYYVGADNGRQTPGGHPLTFRCGYPPRISNGPVLWWRNTCSTAYALSTSVSLRYRIWRSYRIEELAALDDRIRKFVGSLRSARGGANTK